MAERAPARPPQDWSDRLFTDEATAEPYAEYAGLRADRAVCPVRLPDGIKSWFVTTSAGCEEALTAQGLIKNPASVRERLRAAGSPFFTEEYDRFNAHMLNADGADHVRLRRPVSRTFGLRRVAVLRPRIEATADRLLDGLELAGPSATCDLLETYAQPLPLPVICGLLGVPETDAEQVLEWSEALFSPPGFLPLSPERAGELLGEYVSELLRRRTPPEEGSEPQDLIDELLLAPTLSEQEVLSAILLVLLTGHSSTSDFLGNAVVALLTHPEQLDLFRSRPDVVPSAIEELLRFDTSVFRATLRIAQGAVSVQGTEIPAGSVVGVVIGAANRDPERFSSPDELDLLRDEGPHLSFGQGAHYCLGAALARLLAEVGLTRLFARFPDLRLAVPAEELSWMPPGSGIGRCLERLPVVLGDPAR